MTVDLASLSLAARVEQAKADQLQKLAAEHQRKADRLRKKIKRIKRGSDENGR